MIRRFAICCFFLLSFQAIGERASPPEGTVRQLEIVDKAIEFHGGELYRASQARLHQCSKSGCFEVTSRVDGDLYVYTVEGRAGDSVRRVRVTNERVQQWLDGEEVPIEGADLQRRRDWVMARVYFPFLPYRLNDPSVWKKDLGLEAWGERRLHKVKVGFDRGSSTDANDEYLYWFDPKTGRLEQLAYSYEGRPGGLRFRRAVHFERVGGILFSNQENFGVEGAGLRVDLITPDYVEESMRLVSTVELRDIALTPLEK